MAHDNPLLQLKEFGQSIWLDYIERGILEDGTVHHMVEDDGLAGMTSNPAIFEKAISHSDAYDRAIELMASRQLPAREIYERLTIDDVRSAADLLRPVYNASAGTDGYVSLEVSPLLARDTQGTVDEARRLWQEVGRPNLMIKVPGTREGLPAIRRLLADGLNINVTLLFSVPRYLEVIDAFMGGLEDAAAAGRPLAAIASVASFFLSRIDAKVDPKLDHIDSDEAEALRGEAAVASAGLAYRHFLEQYAGARWQTLARKHGARKQRLLWASTSTKNPAYSDVKYVEALIGPETVNTLPMETLTAYRDHGAPEARLQQTVEQAPGIVERLAGVGIDLEGACSELEEEGIRKFVEPYRKLLDAITLVAERKRA